jgi:hypothetical protein
MNPGWRRRSRLAAACVFAAASVLGSSTAAGQEIQLTGPIACAPAAGCPPTKRPHVELAVGVGVLGEARVGGAPVMGATAAALKAEALLLALGFHGPAVGASVALGPTLRSDNVPRVGALMIHAGYAMISSDRHGVDWLDRGYAWGPLEEEDRKELHPVLFLELSAAGRWAIPDQGTARFGVGPRFGTGFEFHRGRCGDSLFGIGADLSLLRDTTRSGPLTLAPSIALRVGLDVPKGDPTCDL